MELKKKYRFWVKAWPEQTSPQKFIYEELAIASYLICIWNEENKKPKFADMGCGNGFLTAILTSVSAFEVVVIV